MVYDVEVVLYISGVGLSVLLVFDCDGHVERPQNVKRATVQGFTLFYVLLRQKLTAVALAAYRWAAYGG